MQEFITEAVVLDRVDSGEMDSRIYLYTKDLGKISARVKSVRKITSKLAGHLEPFNKVVARIIDKNGPQLVDALTAENRLKTPAALKALFFIKELAVEGQPDLELWQFLETENNLDAKKILGVLGFDPAFAKCHFCQKADPENFYSADYSFYCGSCSPAGSLAI